MDRLEFVSLDSVGVGRSAVYTRYTSGHKTLPWGTPCIQIQISRESVCCANRI
jgi:hypothetical protein